MSIQGYNWNDVKWSDLMCTDDCLSEMISDAWLRKRSPRSFLPYFMLKMHIGMITLTRSLSLANDFGQVRYINLIWEGGSGRQYLVALLSSSQPSAVIPLMLIASLKHASNVSVINKSNSCGCKWIGGGESPACVRNWPSVAAAATMTTRVDVNY